ncbi:dihydrofolate reductase [Microlunatus ginsengisoli]|uniref:Dihydrofolate reductase n=1 Tax=Microlunatus ginsengisoli TaxID=363863 RepID=A0ABP6ZHB5_9ACTN
MTEIVAIAAVARNGVIGADGDIPWRVPEDWARFKRLTMGRPLVMGRKTFDSIGRPLPGRTTYVVTRDRRWRGDGVRTFPTVGEAVDAARAEVDGSSGSEPAVVWVAGGGEVYRAAWDRLDRLEITEVDAAPDGDATFPPIAPEQWTETAREPHDGYAFVSYRRRTSRRHDDR